MCSFCRSDRVKLVLDCVCDGRDIMKHYWVVILITLVLLGAACPTPPSILAQAPSPTPSLTLSDADQHEFTITLAELGYNDKALYGPASSANYYFGLPAYWQPLPGSYATVDVEYQAQQIAETTATPQPMGATIAVSLNDRTLKSTSLITSTQTTLQVPLPAEVLAASQKEHSRLTISLNVSGECRDIQRASLVVKDTSRLHLIYTDMPLTLDLALYPYPFYQRSFEPDEVRFVLPPQPTSVEMEGAVTMAASLGKLTGDRMAISSTTSLEWDTQAGEKEHLIIIGKPETNSLIPWLNVNTGLPVSLQPRQMEMVTQGPESVVPGGEITLTAVVTNTADYTVSAPQLRSSLPFETEIATCQPECTEKDRTAQWSLAALSPGEASPVSLTLRVTQPITAAALEWTFSLVDEEHGPLNVNSFTTTVASAISPSLSLITHKAEGEYFFAYGDQAISEGDGIIQEIVSPWDATKALLIVTGLTDEALHKACYALSTRTRFPGMQGPFALVRETHPVPLSVSELESVDVTFADLGYDDKVVLGTRERRVDYWFDMPLGWGLTSEAFVRLLFSHSALIDYQQSSLTVLLNEAPVGSVALDESNLAGGSLQAPLPDSQIRPGWRNRLSVVVDMRLADECYDPDVSQIWSTLSRDSLLHLAHTERANPQLALDFYPRPFAVQPDMHDVAIVLPPLSGPVERDGVLRLIADLANAANGEVFSPAVLIGEPVNWEDLKDYHVIAIGRPSANLAIALVNADLPQPFIPGTDQIEQIVDNVVFRLPAGLSLGYVQEIPSPWNEERAFLAVTGTTDEGVGWAIRALVDSSWRLKGNLALVRDQEIYSTDTRRLTRSGKAAGAATAIPELTPVGTPSPTPPGATPAPSVVTSGTPLSPSPGLPDYKRPAWLIPLVIVIVLAVAVILVIAAWQLRKR
jgi:hypothetical protein